MFSAHSRRPLPVAFPPWGVCVLESHHAGDFRMEMTRHDCFKVLYVLDGTGTIHSERSAQPLRKGEAVAVPARCLHRVEDDPARPLSLLVLCVRRDLLARAGDAPAAFERLRVLRNRAVCADLRETLRRLFFEQSLARSARATMMTGLALQLLASLARAQGAAPREAAAGSLGESSPEARVRTYLEDLERKFFEDEKIDNVCARLGLSRRYFTQLFRRCAGASWLEHLHRLRIAHAKRLLRETRRTVLSVAFESGFDDLSTFYRAFKKSEGRSPQQWRER